MSEDPFAKQYGPPGQGPPGGYPHAPPGNYPPGGPQYWQESPKGKGMAIAALVLGILSLLTFWTLLLTVLGILFGVLAIVFGVIAMVQARKGAAGGAGMALAGLILGLVGFIGGIVVGVFLWVLVKDSGGVDYYRCVRDAGDDTAKVEQCRHDFEQRLDDRFGITPTPAPTR